MSLSKPFFWILVAVVAVFASVPGLTNNVALRESLLLSAVSIILASNLNLMIGFTGYVNFGNIVFFGLGGYFGVWLVVVAGVNLYIAALTGGLMVSFIAFLFGTGILRLRGAFFALATIGIAEAVKAFVSNFEPWGGATGLYLPLSTLIEFGGGGKTRIAMNNTMWTVYYLMIGIMAASLFLSYWIKRSKFGLGLFAIREDEEAAAVLGVNTPRTKAIIYSVSGFLPALAGAFYFFKSGLIKPEEAFDLHRSIEAIVMVMLGGQGSITGPAVGALLYDQLRGYLLTDPVLSSFQLVIAGALLLACVLFVPGGLMGWIYGRWPALRGILE
ncbi:MAG: branched-chain amino acid ABC transporter permease [Rhodospirillaceae bacterium]